MAGASGVDEGDQVFVDVGNGKRVGFVVEPEHDVNGELKATVQVGGDVYDVGYRAPKDRAGQGSGLTFWKKGDK